MYAAPYMNLTRTSKDAIDATIRKSFKTALGIPQATSNEVLGQFGIHNGFEEITRAQHEAQVTRLSKTSTGRQLLRDVGEGTQKKEDEKKDIRRDWASSMYCAPLPKNMNTERNQGRREARARALNKLHRSREHIFHADAGPYPGRTGTYVIAVHNSKQDVTATVKANNIDEAEEAAVALARLQALRQKQTTATITTDSKTTILNMCQGRIGLAAAKLLRKKTPDPETRHTATKRPTLWWHELSTTEPRVELAFPRLRVTTATGPRHTNRAPAQESTWRKLQAKNTLTPTILRRSWPDLFSGRCEDCGLAEGSWSHVYWTCSRNPLPPTLTATISDIGEEDLPA
ncbi:hypothetical protein HPB47_005181 [Ixodes persulcatus]|uniref:Uncharacterized protein n=1 Tax=Ixodes persulcatus TaxID=34615 RepID=A0AC60PDP5_IXOPE|nr:hypothetical protein HPB47_005181 [Ixodes persulcatus]